jgi:hypothetical protein
MDVPLIELVRRIAELPDDGTIFAVRPWTLSSAAAVVTSDPAMSDFDYLLEVGLAREAIEIWSAWRGGRLPTDEEGCEAVIHYAKHDAYLPVGEP